MPAIPRLLHRVRTIQLKQGLPTLDEARRRLLEEMARAESAGVRLLKVVHGWGSGGEGGVLAVGIRRSLRLRAKEGRAIAVVAGERFASDTPESRDLLQRHPALRRDADFNRGNPGITIVELASASARPATPSARGVSGSRREPPAGSRAGNATRPGP